MCYYLNVQFQGQRFNDASYNQPVRSLKYQNQRKMCWQQLEQYNAIVTQFDPGRY